VDRFHRLWRLIRHHYTAAAEEEKKHIGADGKKALLPVEVDS
jgi:hypothetical protein